MSSQQHLRIAIAALAVALLLAAAGCGYSVGTDVDGVSPAGSATIVALEPFRNQTDPYEPGIEVELHRALIEALMPGPYQLDVKERADLYVTGEIVEFKRSTLSQDVNENPAEVQVRMLLQVTVHARSGRQWSDRISPNPEAFAIIRGEAFEDARDRVFRRGARDVIAALTPPEKRW